VKTPINEDKQRSDEIANTITALMKCCQLQGIFPEAVGQRSITNSIFYHPCRLEPVHSLSSNKGFAP
jgi:hypothetical protein